MLTVSQARRLAVEVIKNELKYDRSEFGTHYLGLYNDKHAFEVEIKWGEGLVVDKCLPIIVLVTESRTRIIQNYLSLEILDYFWKKKK